ncbi:MAG: glycosyltransferase family 2 protein [Patescibacteria group bacterium]|nr:glycosyltransferase family 2 protein [Patescibacteria group bacterium]MDD5715957.1 glycosyltransferase family 2 protein [Patescibacteria group bacterium]
MLSGKKICVVVPARNEAERIRRVLETMPAFVDAVYVIDDASTDSTCTIVRTFRGTPSTTVALIQHDRNRGVGAAITSGYRRACKDKIDVCAVMAGDGQMDPGELEQIVLPVVRGTADYVKGNRFAYGNSWQVMPKYRFIGNAILSLLTKIASGYWKLSDFQTGYTAISLAMLQRLPLDGLYPRYGFPNDILVKLNVVRARVCEVPIRPIYAGERSGIRLGSVIPKISWLLMKNFFWRLKEKYIIRDFHPLVFFYFFGGASLLIGLTFGLYLLGYRIFSGPVSGTSALFAAIFFLFGTQSLFFAMWFDMDTNKDLQQ